MDLTIVCEVKNETAETLIVESMIDQAISPAIGELLPEDTLHFFKPSSGSVKITIKKKEVE